MTVCSKCKPGLADSSISSKKSSSSSYCKVVSMCFALNFKLHTDRGRKKSSISVFLPGVWPAASPFS